MVRWVTTRIVAPSSAAAAQYTQQNVQPTRHADTNTEMTVLGRETAQAFAGMVE